MPVSVLGAILLAALLHAAWNAALKAQPDTFVATLAVSTGSALLGALALLFLPAPDAASWPFIAASALLHVVYYRLLAASYRRADIGHAYPLMRGAAPVLVAPAGLAAGDVLRAPQWIALGLVCAGGLALTLGARGQVGADWRSTGPVLLTALVIAAYTLVDGLGVRRAGAPASYTAWVFLSSGVCVVLASWRRVGSQLPAWLMRHPGLAVLGGLASTGSYGIVLWAMTQAPVAVVAALRETSIVFALAIAVLVLGERASRARLYGAGLVALGAAAIKLA